MDIRDSAPPGETDFTTAMPLEISEETASRTDDLLREFAEEAGLDTALVVDRSGALVAGISAEADVTVEVISALVAGASGAMRALVAQLGETGAMESLHLGGNRLIYLKETVHRFILVAVAEAARPAGLVRQQALAIEGRLADLLRDVRPADPPPPAEPPSPPVRSLRETVRERAARRQSPPIPPVIPVPPVETVTGPVFELDSGEDEEEEDGFEAGLEMDLEETPEVVSEVEEPVVLPCDEEPGIEETFETLDLQPELQDAAQAIPDAKADPEELAESAESTEAEEAGTEPSPVDEPTLLDLPEELPPPPVPVDPKEILEPIEFGEPEIVIESSAPRSEVVSRPPLPRIPVDSPFEAEEDDEEADEETDFLETGTAGDSVFEYDAEEEEEDEELIIVTSPAEPEPVPAAEDHRPEPVKTPPPLPVVPPASLFETDDEEDEDEDEEAAADMEDLFEFDDDFSDEADEEASDETGGEFAAITGGVQETILFEMPLEEAPVPVAKREEAPPVPKPSADEEAARELGEMIDEEEEESEIRSSGPFYF